MNTIAPEALVRSARELNGVPWRHLGRGLTGVDCAGLVILAARRAGLDLFAIARDLPRKYDRKASPELLKIISSHCSQAQSPAAGVMVLFRFPGEKHARHMGLLTEAGTVIHAEAKSRRQVVEHGYRAHWLKWTHSLWRLPGVRYE